MLNPSPTQPEPTTLGISFTMFTSLVFVVVVFFFFLQKTTTMSVTSTPIVMNPILSVSQAVRFVCAHRDTASTPLRNHVSQVSFISTSSGTCTQ